MKKYLLFLPFFLLFNLTVFSQSFHFGLKGGADLHKINGVSFKDEFNAGYHVGAFAEIGIPGKIGIQPEVYFSQVNPKTASGSATVFSNNTVTKIKLSYLNIPVLLSLKARPFLAIQAGPQFGILLNKDDALLLSGKNAFKSGDVGIAAGLQFSFTKIKLYGRYVAGLNNIDNSNTGKWRNQNIHLGLGFRIF
ncbi:MAG: porin family protein [Ferruginibacter sp.]